MNKEKVKNYIKRNWVPIAIVAISAVGTGVLVSSCIKSCKAPVYVPVSAEKLSVGATNVPDLKLDVATVTEAWDWDGDPWLILNDLKVSDLGKLSEELIEKIPGVTGDSIITCEMGLLK